MKRARPKKWKFGKRELLLALAVLMCGLLIFVVIKFFGQSNGTTPEKEAGTEQTVDFADKNPQQTDSDPDNSPENEKSALGEEHFSDIYSID